MISYIVFTIPWTTGCIALSPPNAKAIKYRKYLAGAFFGTLVPLVYFFIQHKVHRVPGGKRPRGGKEITPFQAEDHRGANAVASLHHLRLL